MILTLKNRAKAVNPNSEGVYELTPDLSYGLPIWKKAGGSHEIKASGKTWRIWKDGSSNINLHPLSQPYAFERMPDDPNYNWYDYDGDWKKTASGDVNIQGI